MSSVIRGLLVIAICLHCAWASAQPEVGRAGRSASGTSNVLAQTTAAGKAQGVLQAAIPTPSTAKLVSAALPDSIRLKMLAALARGDIRGAISLWQLHTNKDKVPPALQAMQSAYSASNRVMGACIQVGRNIFNGFKAFGGDPQYVRFSPPGSPPVLGWEVRAGEPLSTIQVSDIGRHYAVMLNGKVYDAFTGPEGMLLNEYLKRLLAPGGLVRWEVVRSL